MRILIINPPHESIGSRIPDDHLPPLGLLAIGGPLIDDGHQVVLLDAEFGPMSQEEIVKRTITYNPAVVMLGHSGSTSAQPIISEITQKIKVALPQITIIIGGVYPTYHWKQCLEDDPQIDVVVCGEGEAIARQLVMALATQRELETVAGIAFRRNGEIIKTKAAPIIQDLDLYRVGWELMKPYHYSYWGGKKAVVVQFSRGCPYPCNYCGQSLF
ncbi:MAG: B12-binding domain-containing radical SAM protein [Flammeovirgaceae bacterium]